MRKTGVTKQPLSGGILHYYYLSNLKKLQKAKLVLFEIEGIIRELAAAVKIQEYCFKSHESGSDELSHEDLTLILWNSIILSLFKYMELYEKNKSLFKNAVKNGLAKIFYNQLTEDQIRGLRHQSAHIIKVDDSRENYLVELVRNHRSLIAFYMKIDSYPYVVDRSILNILDQIKIELKLYIGE